MALADSPGILEAEVVESMLRVQVTWQDSTALPAYYAAPRRSQPQPYLGLISALLRVAAEWKEVGWKPMTTRDKGA